MLPSKSLSASCLVLFIVLTSGTCATYSCYIVQKLMLWYKALPINHIALGASYSHGSDYLSAAEVANPGKVMGGLETAR